MNVGAVGAIVFRWIERWIEVRKMIDHRKSLRSWAPIGLAVLATLICTSLAYAKRSPNLLLITCDNLGYGDLPCYNPESGIRSPRLTRLAAEGARLTSFYTASPTCTVSRACLLTGRIPQRHRLLDQLKGVEGNYGAGLDRGELLLPQILKLAETPYVTGCFGKWNIGFAPGARPNDRGFDEFLGHASGNMDYYRHNYRERHDLYVARGNTVHELHRQGEYATTIFADAAIDFVQRHGRRESPWFCYLPFNAPHFPSAGNKRSGQPNVWQAPEEAFRAIGLSANEADPRLRYEAVVYALDHAIGRVLDALEASGQAKNTVVFFMSDNGAFRLNRAGIDVGRNAPLRHGGVTCWEGGIRVPAIVRWPDQIQKGSVIDAPLWSPDLFVLGAKLANVPLPEDRMFDGRDPLPVLTAGKQTSHRSFYFEYRTHAALRMGSWKIVRERDEDPWQLYDLQNDLGEKRNLADGNPGRVKRLREEFNVWRSTFSTATR